MVDGGLTRHWDRWVTLLVLMGGVEDLVGREVLQVASAEDNEFTTAFMFASHPPRFINEYRECVVLAIHEGQFEHAIILTDLFVGIFVGSGVPVETMLTAPVEAIDEHPHVNPLVVAVMVIFMRFRGGQLERLCGLLAFIEHLHVDTLREGIVDLEGSLDEDLEATLRIAILHHLNHQELVVLGDHFERLGGFNILH